MHYYGRRTSGGAFSLGPNATLFASISLYNDSTIGHILRVRWIQSAGGGGANQWANIVQGTLGTFRQFGQPFMAGEMQHAGSIYAANIAAAITTGTIISTQTSQALYTSVNPFAYLRPNTSLSVVNDVINGFLVVGFLWEDLEMSMLEECELL